MCILEKSSIVKPHVDCITQYYGSYEAGYICVYYMDCNGLDSYITGDGKNKKFQIGGLSV